jgi:hypothetical protein
MEPVAHRVGQAIGVVCLLSLALLASCYLGLLFGAFVRGFHIGVGG